MGLGDLSLIVFSHFFSFFLGSESFLLRKFGCLVSAPLLFALPLLAPVVGNLDLAGGLPLRAHSVEVTGAKVHMINQLLSRS